MSSNNYSAGVTVTQNLFSGFHDKYNLEKSDADLQAARAAEDLTGVSLTFTLQTVFYTQLYLQDLVTLLQKTVYRRGENLRLVDLRFQAGRENKGAYLKSRAALAAVSADLHKAKRDLLTEQRNLAMLIGETKPEILTVKGSFDVQSSEVEPDFTALAEATPSYQQALLQAKSSRLGIEVARAAFYPSIDASGGVTRTGNVWPPDTDQYNITLTLSMPLYTGGSHNANLGMALADSAHSEAQLESARRQIFMDLIHAYTGLKDAAENLKVQSELSEADAVQAQIAQSQYDLGLITFQDWDIIENDTIAAEKELLSAREQVALAQAGWIKTLGKKL